MKGIKVFWPAAKERPKTLYLKRGFDELGVPVINKPQLMRGFNFPSNRLGPYVYPLQIVFDNSRSVSIFYDIGTNPDLFHMNPNQAALYLKIHIRKNHPLRRHPDVFVAPNSVSRLEYFDWLAETRILQRVSTMKRDLFFLGWNDDRGLRQKAVHAIKSNPAWDSLVGLQPFKHHKKVPKGLEGQRISFDHFMENIAISKINLALAGGFAQPWTSFRHVEIWGIGAAMLTVSPDCILPGKPRKCWIEFNRNMKDFREVIDYHLEHPAELSEIGQRGLEYFNDYLTPAAHARYFIEKARERLK